MDPADPADPMAAESMKAMRIVSVALLASVLLMLAVVLLLRASMHMGGGGGLDIVAYLATGWAVLSLPVASVLRSARWPGATHGQVPPSYWPRRRAAHIVSIAMLDGAALFCCMALLVSASWLPLLGLLLPLGTMLAWFPREGQEG
jgi:hypothetical protein